METDGTIPFPLKIVWNPCIPSKVSFFSWEACWGKVDSGSASKERVDFGQQVCIVQRGVKVH